MGLHRRRARRPGPVVGKPREYPRGRSSIFALVATTMISNVGALFATLTAVGPPAPGTASAWVLVYFVAIGAAPIGLVSLAIGYAWGLSFITALLGLFLVAQIVSLPAQPAHANALLVFVPFLACNVAALVVARSGKVRAAVDAARKARKARFPEGVGLAFVASFCTLFSSAATIIVLAADVHDAGGPDLVGRHSPLASLLVPLVGVLAACVAIGRLPRSRTPLLALLGCAAVALTVEACVRADLSTNGGMFVVATIALAVTGIVAGTRPRFAAFCHEITRPRGST